MRAARRSAAAQLASIAAAIASAPRVWNVIHTFSARKPRQRSGPKSQGQSSPAARPRGARER